jgi:Transglutaminase-like superfamily
MRLTATGDPRLDTRWRPALQRLVLVPAEHRAASVDLPSAARELGCGPDVLSALVDAGLPAPDGRLDLHDVMNLGLLSGTGRSTAELGERRLMSVATGDPAGWLGERRWRIAFSAQCPQPRCAAPARPLPPAPELAGGRLHGWHPASAEAEAELSTRGRRDEPRTTAVRAVHDDLLAALTAGRYRYGWVPASMTAPEAAALGTVNCVVAAELLVAAATEAGIEARTRTGMLLGLVGVRHAWTEVREEDRWLPLDPVLAYLAGRTPGSNPQFAGFCRGSTANRLLPWDLPARAGIVEHDCALGGQAVLGCRPRPATERKES